VDRTQAHGELVFTYPPFGALMFIPMSRLPWRGAVFLLLVCSAVAYLVAVWLTARRLGWHGPAMLLALVAGLLAAPVVRTAEQGQINLILMALVMVDMWVVPSKYRGTLIGLAAGIKLIPGVFVLYAVIRRDWLSVARSAAAGAATVAVTWAVNPAASSRYWTELVFDTSRSGGGGYPDNQSLVGVLARVLHNDAPPIWLTLPVQAAALALAAVVARRADHAGRPIEALLAIALGGLLASPVSWSHHWVWCVPLVMLLVERAPRLVTWASGLVFLVPPLTLSPLGWLVGMPRPVWILATALCPTVAVVLLVTDFMIPRGPLRPMELDAESGVETHRDLVGEAV
jgi:alpha-1,2-mannosyltransferase